MRKLDNDFRGNVVFAGIWAYWIVILCIGLKNVLFEMEWGHLIIVLLAIPLAQFTIYFLEDKDDE